MIDEEATVTKTFHGLSLTAKYGQGEKGRSEPFLILFDWAVQCHLLQSGVFEAEREEECCIRMSS